MVETGAVRDARLRADALHPAGVAHALRGRAPVERQAGPGARHVPHPRQPVHVAGGHLLQEQGAIPTSAPQPVRSVALDRAHLHLHTPNHFPSFPLIYLLV